MVTLKVLREQDEGLRFERQATDDSRTAIGRAAVEALESELRATTEAEVRFDDGSRALYATDGSNYRQVPIGVVVPRTIDDVVATVAAAQKAGAPILSRGGGTSLAGQCCNVAVVIDFSKHLHHVVAIDGERRLARVQPGCVLDTLRDAASREHGLTFAPDPATHTHCTLGGMLGNNSCGVHSLMAANNGLGLRTSDNTAELEVLTYDGARFRVGPTGEDELERIVREGGRRGEIYARLKALRDTYADEIRRRFPRLPRRVSGYNLDELLPENGFNVARALVGTESTCVTILEATLHLVPAPGARSLLVFGYPDIYVASEHLLEILEYRPTGLEGIDHLLFEWVKNKGDKCANLALLPPGGGYLLIEFGGASKEESDAQARKLMDDFRGRPGAPNMKLYDDPEQEEMIWKVREGSLGSTAWIPGLPDTWPGWEDSAVPVPEVAGYLRGLRALMDKYGYHPSLYGHLGQGCIHCRISFDVYTAEGLEAYRSFMDEATDLVLRHGGSLSGEHGDGQSRAQFLPKMFGEKLVRAFREFKAVWDPQRKMNPGKVVDAYTITENLRIGPDYNPPSVQTHFQYLADEHSFARAALRCVGIGECRREGGQTMCPSYMVTREEMHSTRGRARLLWEMLNGETLTGGWKSEPVKEALDLCLACKGCKGDCPVNVDMATYKAEFLSHYYAGPLRLRPRHAYAFGWIHVWSRLASVAPRLFNLLTQTPGLRAVAKWLAGMEQERRIPPFAPQTFQGWLRRHRTAPAPERPPVILFADTFNNHFHPDTAIAAVEVLEDAGFDVAVPIQDLCCGRPLYDYGFLDMAKRWLLRILRALQPYIHAGVPMVVLEPSCWAVFKDELTNLLPDLPDAQRLRAQTYTLGEILCERAPGYRPPPLHKTAILHGHCHQKALDALDNRAYGSLVHERKVLKDLGVDFRMPEDGCCGMAGAFGFERGDHYEVSIRCGERVLIPEVKKAGEDELLIADGFSCREQIEQTTSRRALHLAEVIQMALRGARGG